MVDVEVLKTVDAFRTWRAAEVGHKRTLGLVPTLGALHEGHMSLVRRALATNDLVAVSVFLNPLQFGPGEDYAAYPRALEHDLGLLLGEGVHAVFAPDRAEFTPPDSLTTVSVSRLTERFEGAARSRHFEGVVTIVTKLFNVVQPQRAYFGEKDYQQLVVVRRLATDLNLPVEIVAGETVRDPRGLALSSRNVYLSASQREKALALSTALFEVARRYDGDADEARKLLRTRLQGALGVRLEYADVVDPSTLEPLAGSGHGCARALVAAYVGRTRLIDNLALKHRPDAEGEG